MRLFDAARYFDSVLCKDAYTDAVLCVGQFEAYDDSKRDAYGAERRILSLSPDQELPTRLALRTQIGAWLLGKGQADVFRGTTIRIKYVTQRADHMAAILAPDQLLAGEAGLPVCVSIIWLKDVKQQEVSSAPPSLCEIFLAANERVVPGQFILSEGELYCVHSTHTSEAGFFVAEAERLEQLPAQGQLRSIELDPVLDTETVVTTELPMLLARWQLLFVNTAESALKAAPTDKVIMLPGGSGAKAGDRIDLSGFSYRVAAKDVRPGCDVLHVRGV